LTQIGVIRSLLQDGAVPLLEQSQDNGATWSLIAPIGTEPLPLPPGELALATTPLAPSHLCAGLISPGTNHVFLAASGDGGRTWRSGTMPAALQRAQGETSLTIASGATGDCYEGFLYALVQEPAEGNAHYGFLRLASESAVLHFLPLTDDANRLAPTFVYVPNNSGYPSRRVTKLDGGYPCWASYAYVPAGNGMPSRLITELDGGYPGWASLFSGLAAETTNDGQIVWHAVP
jgi:hypothetical protein